MNIEINPKQSYIYARKSTEDAGKQVESIAKQTEVSLDTAGRYNTKLEKSRILKEEKSASKPGRPIFNQLMEIVEQNNRTTIFCWHFNRLSRNSKDDGWIRHLIETGKLTVITPHQVFDKSTNAVITAVEGAQGTQYSRDLSRMVTEVNIRRRKKGISPGQPSPGYKWAGERGRMYHAPDGHRWQLVHDALHLVLDGIPPTEVLEKLNDEWGYRSRKQGRKVGNRPMTRSTWYKVLNSPYYYGKFIAFVGTSEEKIMNGKHKPMITEEQFWKIQELLGDKGRVRPRLKKESSGAAYLKLIKCGECKAYMQHDYHKQQRCNCGYKYSSKNRDVCPQCDLPQSKTLKPEREYDFWECRTKGCKQSIFHTEKLEEQLTQTLDSLTIPQEFIDWAMEYLESENESELKSHEAKLESLQKAETQVEKELNRLNQLYVRGGFEHEDGDIEYRDMKKNLLAKQTKIKSDKAKLIDGSNDWRAATESGYRFCRDAASIYKSKKTNYRTKRDIFTSLVEEATIKENRLILDIEPPFEFIKKKLDSIKQEFGITEPEKPIDILALSVMGSNDVLKNSWLAGSDSNRQPSDYI